MYDNFHLVINFPLSNRNKEKEREMSKKQMWESYEGMMNTYAQQQKALANRPAWIAPKTRGAEEPPELTVTHVNHTRDLLVNILKSNNLFYQHQPGMIPSLFVGLFGH